MEPRALAVVVLNGAVAGALSCEAFIDFEGLEYTDEVAHAGGEAGAGAGHSGGSGGAAGAGGAGHNCQVDASRSDDFLSIPHTEALWRTLEINEPDQPMKTQDTTGVGRLNIVPRTFVFFQDDKLASLTYQDVCGDFGLIVIGHADNNGTGPAPASDKHGIGIMIHDPDDGAQRWVILRSSWIPARMEYALYSEWAEGGVSTPNPDPYVDLINSTSDYALMVCRVSGQVHLLHKRAPGGTVTVGATIDDYGLPDLVHVGFTVERPSDSVIRGSFSGALFDHHGSLASCQSALEAALE